MAFTSEIFLFAFLPAVLVLSLIPGVRVQNVLLVIASLVFYWWGEGRFVALILGSALVNYAFGAVLARLPGIHSRRRRWIVTLAVAVNLGILIAFKYAGFFSDNLSFITGGHIGRSVALSNVYLPLGISFFTFHAISYVVDVYRRTAEARRNPIEVVLYFVLFPQLIAGPIVRFKDIAAQLSQRSRGLEDFAYGVRRFVVGLAKKVLIADTLGVFVDRSFATPPGEIALPVAWITLLAYGLQIYFDFSGYSDMAIGLARMFGFRLLENFNFPYVASSIQDFWRRWHISLSRWFRDYLYIPLGGNRVAAWRLYLNLVAVFFLAGLWHGAKWTFVIWGLIHGTFLVLERVGAVRRITATPVLRHVYALTVVGVAWVFFRADSVAYALGYLATLVRPAADPLLGLASVDRLTLLALAAGCICATPYLPRRVEAVWETRSVPALFANGAAPVVVAGLFVVTLAKIVASTYRPFIYFHF